MAIAVALAGMAAVAWLYLLAGHGWFWRTGGRLPHGGAGPGPRRWPAVTAVVPARDEAAILPQTLPTLMGQDYPGVFQVLLVDDSSSDGTAAIAGQLREGRPGVRLAEHQP